MEIIEGYGIIHLAGYSIVKPWTRANQKMFDRVKAAELLYETVVKEIKLKTFILRSYWLLQDRY